MELSVTKISRPVRRRLTKVVQRAQYRDYARRAMGDPEAVGDGR